MKLFQRLPKIENHYTPWLKPHQLTWGVLRYPRTPDHGDCVWHDYRNPSVTALEIKTIFGLLFIAKGQDHRIGLQAQSWTTCLFLGQLTFAFRSINQRSCANCKNYSESHSFDRDSGPDVDIDCKADWPNDESDYPQLDIVDYDNFWFAWRCPAYRYFNWDAQHKIEAEQEALAYAAEVEAERRYQEYLSSDHWLLAREESQIEHYKERGWMDAQGNLTNEFFIASDLAYDAARETRYR